MLVEVACVDIVDSGNVDKDLDLDALRTTPRGKGSLATWPPLVCDEGDEHRDARWRRAPMDLESTASAWINNTRRVDKEEATDVSDSGGGSEGFDKIRRDPTKHVEIPVPSPKKGEVLLKVEAATINPADWKIQKGLFRPIWPKFPIIPVSDVAGEVIEVGPGVQSFKSGDKIVSMFNFLKGGGLAEYAIADSSRPIVHRPPEVSAADGACLPIAACTALQALKSRGAYFDATPRTDDKKKIENVLITAASGGVGTFATQLAKLSGLHVTATCGARNIDLVKSLGADEVLDYKTPEGASLKSPSGRKYDAVVNCADGISWSKFETNLSANGKVIDITFNPGPVVKSLLKKLLTFSKKQMIPLFSVPNNQDMTFLVELLKEGKLKTVVDSRYPLSNAEEAWSKSMDGHATGKIIIEIV